MKFSEVDELTQNCNGDDKVVIQLIFFTVCKCFETKEFTHFRRVDNALQAPPKVARRTVAKRLQTKVFY